MRTRDEQFDQAFKQLATDVVSTLAMEHALNGKGPLKVPKPRGRSKKALVSAAANDLSAVYPRDPVEIAHTVLAACNRKRKAATDEREALVTNDALSKMARFTDKFKLKPYEQFLHYVPRLVNIVTVCAPPIPKASIPSTPFTQRWNNLLPVRSWQRPFPYPEAVPLCRSTSAGSQPAAATPTTRPRNSAQCSWPTRSRGAACWSSVSV